MSEMINHPSHYIQEGRKECIVEMEERYGSEYVIVWCLMNAYKYLYRAGNKSDNPMEQDKGKAQWYFDYANKLLDDLDYGELIKKQNLLYHDIKEMLENDR